LHEYGNVNRHFAQALARGGEDGARDGGTIVEVPASPNPPGGSEI
jgi:hypothetical protein